MMSGRIRTGIDTMTDGNIRLLARDIELLMGTVMDVTFPQSTHADVAIEHGLGVIPNSFVLENQDRPGSVFRGVADWTTTTMYLQTDTPGMRCMIRARQTGADN